MSRRDDASTASPAAVPSTSKGGDQKKKKPFRERYSLEKRQRESKQIKDKYPDRFVLIVETDDDSIGLKQNKFLVPREIVRREPAVAAESGSKGKKIREPTTLGHFMIQIRKRCSGTLSAEKALFYFVESPNGVGKEIAPATALLQQLVSRHENEDGFLYIEVTQESTFG